MTDHEDGGKPDDPKLQVKLPMNKWIGLGIGAGIGSAAIAAALLYAGSTRKKPGNK